MEKSLVYAIIVGGILFAAPSARAAVSVEVMDHGGLIMLMGGRDNASDALRVTCENERIVVNGVEPTPGAAVMQFSPSNPHPAAEVMR